MMYKVVAVLAVLCFVQAIQGAAAKDLSRETRYKLNDALIKARNAKEESLEKVKVIRGAIKEKVKAALKPIEERIDAIKEESKKEDKIAKKREYSIDDCIKDEEKVTHHFNEDVVKDCKKTPETVQALDLVEEIGYQIQRLNRAVSRCGGASDINVCVNKTVEDVNVKIPALQKRIAKVLSKSDPKAQERCISEGIEKLQAILDETVRKFRACVAAHRRHHDA